MDINFEKLAQQEVERLVKEKLNSKLHLQIQKELKSHQYYRIISDYVNKEIHQMINSASLMDLIDKDKLQEDVTRIISNELLNRMTTSFQCDCTDDPYSYDY